MTQAVDKPPAAPLGGPLPPRLPRRPSGGRRWIVVAVILGLAALIVTGAIAVRAGSAPPPPTPAPPADRIARGLVRPIHQARVGTLAGGVVGEVVVQVGQTVENQQPLARVRTAGGVELLTAPWRGTVTNLAVGRGDTVAPGTTLVTIADLSRLEIETTDLDEFLIVHIVPGQIVSVTVEAFDAPAFSAVIRTIAPEARPNRSGDDHYPVILEPIDPPADLRPGMTVRVQIPRNRA